MSALAVIGCHDGSDVVQEPGPTLSASPNQPPLPGDTDAEPRADINASVVMKGKDREIVVVASAPPPFVLKNTTPFSVALRGDAGITFAKATLDRHDYVDPEKPDKTVSTKVTAPPGDHTIDVDADLYSCSAKLCKPIHQHVTTRFTVPKS